jgi:predicted transcriptional regulator YdeE
VHRIVTAWSPAWGYRISGEPDLVERYSEDFDPVTNAGNVEIWIRVVDS